MGVATVRRSHAPARRVFATVLAIALTAAFAACDGAPPEPSPYWRAIETLDLAAARAQAATDDQRTFVDLVERALGPDPEAAAAALGPFGNTTGEAALRARATALLLDMLRGTCCWRTLATLRERWPKLPLGADYLPAGLRSFAGVELTLPAGTVRLPLLPCDGPYAIVEAQLTGTTTAPATASTVIDTGANLCVLTPALAERLGVAPIGAATVAILDINGMTTTGRPAVLREFALGGLVARNLPITIVDLRVLGAEFADLGFILGWEVLQHLAFEVSGQKRELVLRRSEPDPDLRRNLFVLDQPTVRIRSGDVDLLFLLDTGAGATKVRRHVPELLGITPTAARADQLTGLGGTIATAVATLAKLPVGIGPLGLELGNVGIDPQDRNPRDLLRIDGTLGIDLAQPLRLIVDGPNRHVRLVVE